MPSNEHDRLKAIEDKADKILAILNGDASGNGVMNRLTKQELWSSFYGACLTVLACISTTALGLIAPWYFHQEK